MLRYLSTMNIIMLTVFYTDVSAEDNRNYFHGVGMWSRHAFLMQEKMYYSDECKEYIIGYWLSVLGRIDMYLPLQTKHAVYLKITHTDLLLLVVNAFFVWYYVGIYYHFAIKKRGINTSEIAKLTVAKHSI